MPKPKQDAQPATPATAKVSGDPKVSDVDVGAKEIMFTETTKNVENPMTWLMMISGPLGCSGGKTKPSDADLI